MLANKMAKDKSFMLCYIIILCTLELHLVTACSSIDFFFGGGGGGGGEIVCKDQLCVKQKFLTSHMPIFDQCTKKT